MGSIIFITGDLGRDFAAFGICRFSTKDPNPDRY